MEVPEFFEQNEQYTRYRPVATVSLSGAITLISKAILFAREQRIRRLLVDITGLSGFAPPTLSERFRMVTDWANAAEGRVKLAMVAHPNMIDPERFGVTVAQNRGLNGNIFSSETEALTWLLVDP